MGIGGFVNVSGIQLKTFIAGGTGSDSLNLEMPSGNEAKFEMASSNIVAIAGLNAALECLDQKEHLKYEQMITECLISKLETIRGVNLFLPTDLQKHVGIVSFTIDGFSSEDIGNILDEDFDIAVRTGYHCAPYIHKYLKDEKSLGTIRVGLGQFNTEADVNELCLAISEILGGD